MTKDERARILATEADRLLGVADLVARLPFSRKIVLRMIHERRIPAMQLNGKWCISRDEYRRALAAGFPLPTGRARSAA